MRRSPPVSDKHDPKLYHPDAHPDPPRQPALPAAWPAEPDPARAEPVITAACGWAILAPHVRSPSARVTAHLLARRPQLLQQQRQVLKSGCLARHNWTSPTLILAPDSISRDDPLHDEDQVLAEGRPTQAALLEPDCGHLSTPPLRAACRSGRFAVQNARISFETSSKGLKPLISIAFELVTPSNSQMAHIACRGIIEGCSDVVIRGRVPAGRSASGERLFTDLPPFTASLKGYKLHLDWNGETNAFFARELPGAACTAVTSTVAASFASAKRPRLAAAAPAAAAAAGAGCGTTAGSFEAFPWRAPADSVRKRTVGDALRMKLKALTHDALEAWTAQGDLPAPVALPKVGCAFGAAARPAAASRWLAPRRSERLAGHKRRRSSPRPAAAAEAAAAQQQQQQEDDDEEPDDDDNDVLLFIENFECSLRVLVASPDPSSLAQARRLEASNPAARAKFEIRKVWFVAGELPVRINTTPGFDAHGSAAAGTPGATAAAGAGDGTSPLVTSAIVATMQGPRTDWFVRRAALAVRGPRNVTDNMDLGPKYPRTKLGLQTYRLGLVNSEPLLAKLKCEFHALQVRVHAINEDRVIIWVEGLKEPLDRKVDRYLKLIRCPRQLRFRVFGRAEFQQAPPA